MERTSHGAKHGSGAIRASAHDVRREAFPGDVFYLHSRLLERAAKLNQEKGGGSLTALPFIETQAGDVSAYIPTNVISITDGQIFLEADLFNSNVRPAVNVGISVSRVGGNAQIKAMRQYSPQPVEKQVLLIFAGTNGYVDDLPVEALKQFEEELYRFADNAHPAILRDLREKRSIDDTLKTSINEMLKEFKGRFAAEHQPAAAARA